jgi:ATP-dependent DNA helicase RecQ
LGVPFLPILRKIKEVPPQKEMRNSAQQAANAERAFSVVGQCLPGPVLLVDDMFDSRWTLTYCGVKLRQAGSGPVYPFTLARATSTEN